MDTATTNSKSPNRQRREWILVGLVGLLALMSNLPGHWLQRLGLDSRYFTGVLGMLVLLALFLYLRFFFFLLFSLLAVGVNIPAQWADALGIDRTVLLATLSLMVALSLLNYKMKLLPTGFEKRGPTGRNHSTEGIKALMTAVEKGHIGNAGKVLSMSLDLDMQHADGQTPLTRAAELGDKAMVELLLRHGASPEFANAAGLIPAEAALKSGHLVLYEMLKPRNAAAADSAEQDSKLGD